MSLLVAIDVATKNYVGEGKVRLELEVALDELAEFFAVFVAHVHELDPTASQWLLAHAEAGSPCYGLTEKDVRPVNSRPHCAEREAPIAFLQFAAPERDLDRLGFAD
jgi:hypothetical protein